MNIGTTKRIEDEIANSKKHAVSSVFCQLYTEVIEKVHGLSAEKNGKEFHRLPEKVEGLKELLVDLVDAWREMRKAQAE